jgi:HEPN domain-containing protein
MQPNDSGESGHVEQWIAKAEQDFALASELLAEDRPFWDAICFHAQQAAEKYLKAYLVYREVDFPKTHDVEHLLDLIEEADAELAGDLRDIAPLSAYAVAARYPGVSKLTAERARRAVEMACKARAAIRAALQPSCDDLNL